MGRRGNAETGICGDGDMGRRGYGETGICGDGDMGDRPGKYREIKGI